MEKICPICNELEEKLFKCEKCGGAMHNEGIVQEYMGDYMQNMEIQDSEEFCIHIYRCEKCDFFKNQYIKKVLI